MCLTSEPNATADTVVDLAKQKEIEKENTDDSDNNEAFGALVISRTVTPLVAQSLADSEDTSPPEDLLDKRLKQTKINFKLKCKRVKESET